MVGVIIYEILRSNMNYQLTSLPGLAGIVKREAQTKLDQVRVADVTRVRNADVLAVTYAGDPRRLKQLQTVEDVFVVLGRVKLSGQLSDIKALPAAGLWKAPLRDALSVWSMVTGKPLAKRQVFRVVVQADDAGWRQYRRQEITLAAERALLTVGSSWRLNRDEAPLEIWLQQAGRELLVSVRLTTGADRQHGGRTVEREAALRPSVAAAMVFLSQPEDDDVFLDPMCGSGTILLERAMAGRYGLLLGGDIDKAAVGATLANFGPRHQPRRIERWDATSLPLDDASANKIACNLPWGRQVGEKAAMPALYAAFLREAVRVLASGGRMVLLTSEWEILKRAIKGQAGLELEQTVSSVEVLGRRADMFVLTRARR